jgi:CHAD domain-containing protein
VLDDSSVTDPLGRTHRLSRVDLVIPTGSAEAFQDLADVLRRECDLTEASRSRFEWAAEACGIQADRTMSFGSASVDPLMSVGQVVDAVLRKQCASFFWHEPGARLGEDPEPLHDMRVASRRMRAALLLFRSALPPGEADGLRLRLREVARALGAVRDLDVFIIQLGELSAKLVGTDADACGPLLRHLSRSRERARQQMMKLLDDSSFIALKRTLTSRMHTDTDHETPQAEPSILTAGPVLIRQCRRRVLRSGRGLRPDSPAADYHELRIRGKRLRYLLEFLEGVYGPPARNLIDALVAMQDQLGLLQDARVSVQALRAITEAKPAGFTRKTWVALGELIQLYEGRTSDLRRGIPRLLHRLDGKRWRALRRAMKKLAVAEEGKQSDETRERDTTGNAARGNAARGKAARGHAARGKALKRNAAKADGCGVDPPSGDAEDPLIGTDSQDQADPPTTEE